MSRITRRRPLREDTNEVSVQEENEGSGEEKPYESDSAKPDNADPPNPLSWAAIPWHLGMVVFYSLLIYYSNKLTAESHHILDPNGRIPSLGGRFKYLTHINLHVQLLFFTVQLFADVLPKPFEKSGKKLANIVFATVAFPLATIVASVFWGLYAVDRRLIYPEIFDLFVPTYLNHFWHSTILLWVLCEIFLVYHHYPTIATASMLIFVFGSGYIGWVVYLYVQTEWWVYPFMKVLSLYGMVLFFGSNLLLMLGFYLLGKVLSYARWGVMTHLD